MKVKSLSGSKIKKFVKGGIIAVLLFSTFLIYDLLFPLPEFTRGYSQVIYSKDGTIINVFLSPDDKWRIRTDNSEVSGVLAKAIIFKEDKYFYYHPGVNPVAVVKALWNNTIKHRRVSGASTITMQVARLIDPAERTMATKLRESIRALQLEWHYSKNEILGMYLNLLPYGGNIEGVKAASMIYFGQQPAGLSPAQLAMLTVIPNDPNSLMPKYRQALLYKRNYWIKRMEEAGLFSKEEVDDALTEGFETTRYPLPKLAPHLSYRLKTENRQTDKIHSTLNMPIQSKVEAVLAGYVRSLRTMQVTNASVIVLNNRTMEVMAYAGSAGFDEDIYFGQVDGVKAIRSPGSALKPALYLMAFDKGYVSPKTVVSDVPVNFSGYSPENYDESYRGKVTIEQALALSLNVPSVELLDRAGLDDMNDLLGNANFKWITQNRKKTGLSLILGGCGTTLEELTGLYAAFANKGKWQPLIYLVNDDDPINHKQQSRAVKGTMIGSPAAASMITEILTQLKRPDLPNEYTESAHLPRVAWKTGTSYGRRDAWALGYNATYTVGVWAGNFDGQGIPNLNGTDCAVPVLFAIFNQLSGSRDEWFAMSPDADFRLVCTETGMIPDTFCHNTVMETYIPGISPSIRCNHLRPVFVKADESASYCSECRPGTGYKTVLYPNLPASLISYYDEMMIPYRRIPEHNPECTVIQEEDGPLITSLTDGAEYLLIAGKKQRLMLKCSAENGTTEVYWYVDKKFVAKATPHETVVWEAQKGMHTITCSDNRGRSRKITVSVSVI